MPASSRLPAKTLAEQWRLAIGRRQVEQRGDFVCISHQARRRDRRRRDPRMAGIDDLAAPVGAFHVTRQLSYEAVVEAEGIEAARFGGAAARVALGSVHGRQDELAWFIRLF